MSNASPFFRNSTAEFAESYNGRLRNMDTHDGDLFMVQNDRLTSFDISDAATPTELDFELTDEIGCIGLRITSDGWAYVGGGSDEGGDDRLFVFDVSDSANISLETSISDVQIDGLHGLSLGPNEDILYAAGYSADTFVSVDISTRDNPTILDSITVTEAHDVAVRSDGAYAFIPQYTINDVVSVDISDPTNMSVVGTLEYDEFWKTAGARLTADESHLIVGYGYGSDQPGGILSIDVSDPTALSEASRADGLFAYRLRVREINGREIAIGTGRDIPDDWYAGDEAYGLDVFEVTDPAKIEFRDRDIQTVDRDLMTIEVEFHPDDDVAYGAARGTTESEPVISSWNVDVIEPGSGFALRSKSSYSADSESEYATQIGQY